MIKWTGIALGLMIVGLVVLILVLDWHWITGSVVRKASAAIGHTVLLAGDLDVDRPWPSTVQMGIFDWHWIKGYVARKASAALGRTVVIEGALDVDLTWPPTVRVEQVRLANAPWSPAPYMLEIRRLVCRIDLFKLLQGRIILPMVELGEPVVRLETSEQGEPNWKFGQPQTEEGETASGAVPIIERLSLRDGHLTYHDYASHKRMTATLTEVQALATGSEQRLEVEGAGQFEGTPFRFAGHGGALQDLGANTPYPVQMQLVIDQWQMDLNGTIAQPLQLQGVAAAVSVARLSPDQPSDSQDQAAPSQAPYRLVGQLTREGDTWAVREIAATLGKSDLAGTIRLEMSGKPPLVQAELSSHTLDVRDLSAFSGAPDQQKLPQAAETQSEDVPPEAVIDLELTRVVNARLHFQGQTVMLANQTLHNVSTDLALHDGHLSLRPAFDLAGGTIRAQIEVDDRGDASLHSAIRAEIEQVNVQQVLATLGMEHKVAGTVHGQIDLAASGRSLTALTESLAGKATLTVKDQASNTDVQMHVATEVGAQQATSRVRIASQGRLYGEPFHLDGRVGAWRGGQQPAPVQVQLRLGETRARLDGTLGQDSQHPGLAAQVTMQGADPARLSALLPISIPSLPAYRVAGRLLQNGSTWTLKGFKATIGDSDLAGELSLDTGGEHLVLRGDLHSQTFVVDELTGSRPEKKPGRVEPEKVRVPEEVKEEVQEKVQERPQAIEADLRFRGNKVIVTKIPLEQFSTDVRFHNGRLALTPTFRLAEGTVQAQVQLESRADPLQSTLRVKVYQVNVQQLLTWIELTPEDAAKDAAKPKTTGQSAAPEKPAPPEKAEVPGKPKASGEPEVAKQPETAEKLGTAGKLDGQIDLTGAGSSLADFLASANGNVLLSMAEGQLGTVLTELVGLDVAQTIQKALSKDKAYQLRCLVADFAVHNGRMETQMLLVDTTDTKVIGGGFIDMHDKQLGLKLEPKAKDFSLFSVQAPLYIIGPLANPSAGPKLGEMLRSLSMPIKPGQPEDADCQAVREASQRRYQTSKP